jgi:hypothetical protein
MVNKEYRIAKEEDKHKYLNKKYYYNDLMSELNKVILD